MLIDNKSEKISYSGRIDFSESGATFYFPATSATVRFRGSKISATVNNSTMWGIISLGYVIDGRLGKVPLERYNDNKDTTYEIANSLDANEEHTLTLYKVHAANNILTLVSIETDGEFLDAPEKPKLKLEVYGDSVSAGECLEAVDFVGRCDPTSHAAIYDNSWYSYTWQTARALNAELHDIAQGGIAVFDDTGYFNIGKYTGMVNVYDKVKYFGGEPTKWDFSKYIPDVVILALGQNDAHDAINDCSFDIANDSENRAKRKEGYKKLVKDIAKNYPDSTKYIFLTTVLCHDADWDNAIDEISNELKADGLCAYHLLFKRAGKATPGHPRIPEHNEMTAELVEFIKEIL